MDAEVSIKDLFGRRDNRLRTSLQQHLDPCIQFTEIERLYHVVVGSHIKAFQFVVCRAQSCQHQNGYAIVEPTYLATQFKAIQLGKNNV